jgi:hypothetical protein
MGIADYSGPARRFHVEGLDGAKDAPMPGRRQYNVLRKYGFQTIRLFETRQIGASGEFKRVTR